MILDYPSVEMTPRKKIQFLLSVKRSTIMQPQTSLKRQNASVMKFAGCFVKKMKEIVVENRLALARAKMSVTRIETFPKKSLSDKRSPLFETSCMIRDYSTRLLALVKVSVTTKIINFMINPCSPIARLHQFIKMLIEKPDKEI